MAKAPKKEGGFDFSEPVAWGILGVLAYGAFKHFTRDKSKEKEQIELAPAPQPQPEPAPIPEPQFQPLPQEQEEQKQGSPFLKAFGGWVGAIIAGVAVAAIVGFLGLG